MDGKEKKDRGPGGGLQERLVLGAMGRFLASRASAEVVQCSTRRQTEAVR